MNLGQITPIISLYSIMFISVVATQFVLHDIVAHCGSLIGDQASTSLTDSPWQLASISWALEWKQHPE